MEATASFWYRAPRLKLHEVFTELTAVSNRQADTRMGQWLCQTLLAGKVFLSRTSEVLNSLTDSSK